MSFEWITLVILILFYGTYFIKMFQQKRRGIQTDQIGQGKEGFLKFVEITMKVAAFLEAFLAVISILFNESLTPTPIRFLGVALSTLGTGIFIAAVAEMKDNWRAGVSKTDHTELVTSGIYQISRNPAFLGFDLFYLGVLLTFFNWPLFFCTCFAVLMYHLQIVNVEEDFLISAFGQQYLDYRKTVRRYLGRKRWK